VAMAPSAPIAAREQHTLLLINQEEHWKEGTESTHRVVRLVMALQEAGRGPVRELSLKYLHGSWNHQRGT
jgi:hypothetical protein